VSESFSPKIDPAVLGDRIRELRRRQGLRQSALVGELISSGYISLIEQGKRYPSSKALAHIANVLQVSVGELTKPPSKALDPDQEALLAQAEALVAMGEYKSPQSLISKLEPETLSSLRGRMLTIDLDYDLDNFIAADIPVKALIEDAIAALDWDLARKAIVTCGRISDFLDTTVESTIFFSNIKRNLNRIPNVDPLLMAQLIAIIADRLVFLGDLFSAQKMLTELDVLLPKVKDKRGRASGLWVSASVAYESGDFERAIVLNEEAQTLFGEELDSVALFNLKLARARILADCASNDDPRIAQTVSEFEQLIVELESRGDLRLLLHVNISLAYLLILVRKYDQAEKILLEFLKSDDASNSMFYAHNLVNLAIIQVRRGDINSAKSYLDSGWNLIRNFEPITNIRRQMVEIADLYAELGEKDMVIEVLRATNKPVGNFAAILQD
jgi:transcriptional regulator with XRE-family HTH domain